MSEAPLRTVGHWLVRAVLGAILTAVLVAAFWPVTFSSQEELFEIPLGTWARRMAGDKHEYLPSDIYLMVGIHNVLKLKNSDNVPQFFGPTLLMPKQTLSIPFTRPSENFFSCTAHADGRLLVVVEATPVWPWERLIWRGRHMVRSLSKP